MRSPRPLWLDALLAALAYAVATFVVTWPVFRHPASSVLDTMSLYGDAWTLVQRDINLTMWILAWDTHALTTDPTTLFHANTFHPAPWVLATSEHMLGNVPWFGPVFLLSGNPVLAHQVTLFASFVVAGLTMAAWVLYWTRDRAAAFLAGLVYMLAPYRLWQLGNLHVIAIQYLPLVTLGIDGIVDRRRPTFAALLLWIGLAASTLCSYYVGYAAFVLAGVYAVMRLPSARPALGSAVVRLAIAGGLAAVVVGLVTIPYIMLQQSGALPDHTRDSFNSLAFWAVLKFGIGGLLQWFVLPLREGIPQYLTATAMLLALAAIGLHRRAPRGALVATAVTGVVLFLGPSVPNPWAPGESISLPYEVLAAVVPGFSAMRAPQRFGCLTTLAIVGLAGIGLATVRARLAQAGRGRIAAALPLLLAATLVVEVRPRKLGALPVSTVGTTPEAAAWLRAHGEGGALLNLPFNRHDLHRESGYLYESIFHWLPIVNGYAAYPPTAYVEVGDIAFGMPSAEALQGILARVDVRWVLLHLKAIPPPWRASWTTPLDASLTRVGEWSDAILYEVPARR